MCLLFILQLLCSGNITSSALTLSTIDHAEDDANKYGIGYQGANAYRIAAGCLVSVNIVALIFHLSVVIFPLLYPSAAVGKNFKSYIFIVSGYNHLVIQLCLVHTLS